jgi:hypothetical protein
LRGTVTVDPVVQVGRPATRVTRVAGVADDVARLNTITWTEGGVALQMRIGVPLEAWPENPDHLARESIRAARCPTSRRTAERDV